jgi:DNA polymerase III subunit epsilon
MGSNGDFYHLGKRARPFGNQNPIGKEGLKLAPDQKPVAMKAGGSGPYDLYDKRTAVPKRKSSQAQLEAAARNLERARAALLCADCGSYEQLDANGRCRDCRQHHQRAEMSRRAGERLRQLAAANDWLIIDTETTGLHEAAEIIQVGVVDASGRVVMNQLIKPTESIPPDAVSVHGLDDVALAGAPTWVEVYPEIDKLLNGRRLLTYNADFDRRMIRQTCLRHGTAVPKVASWECVMELMAAYIGEWSNYHNGFKWHGLTAVYSMLELRPFLHELGPVHDAAGDAWLVWRLMQAFREVHK